MRLAALFGHFATAFTPSRESVADRVDKILTAGVIGVVKDLLKHLLGDLIEVLDSRRVRPDDRDRDLTDAESEPSADLDLTLDLVIREVVGLFSFNLPSIFR